MIIQQIPPLGMDTGVASWTFFQIKDHCQDKPFWCRVTRIVVTANEPGSLRPLDQGILPGLLIEFGFEAVEFAAELGARE